MGTMPGYFDHNATTPTAVVARRAWIEAEESHWHNPSGLYREAGEARRVLEDWREALADHLDVEDPERLVFTSSATEANNAVVGHFARNVGGVIVTSEIEHPSVGAPASLLEKDERLRRLPTDPSSGAVELGYLREWISKGEVGAVSLMAANNETGALQPWREAAALCREAEIPFHTDAAQWIGKLPVCGFHQAGFVTGSAHKFGGGKGVGFLVLPGEELGSPFHGLIGGPQEQGRRAGTENLPGVASMVAALLERGDAVLADWSERQVRFRDDFEFRLEKEAGVKVLAKGGDRLWNTSMFVLPEGKNVKWLARLSQRGYSVSTGSACSAGKENPSSVMMAMGLSFEEMGRVLRISGGGETGEEEWLGLAEALIEVGKEIGA